MILLHVLFAATLLSHRLVGKMGQDILQMSCPVPGIFHLIPALECELQVLHVASAMDIIV